MSPGKNILFAVTGSIAAYKACQEISRLVQDGHIVQTVATAGALEFVGKATLEGLTGREVFSDVYQAGRMMDHINLQKWADLFIICPATANTLNGLAVGLSGDVVGALALAHDFTKPFLIVPAMNQKMYAHPATQSAILKLTEFGVRVLAVAEGHQACGDTGQGRMLEPEQIHKEIHSALSAGGWK